MPGLNSPSLMREYVRAPEQEMFALWTPSPLCTSADFERWQPGVDSAPGMSWYADEPSASVFDGAPFVLPAQRPASPEMAESPSATTDGGAVTIRGSTRMTLGSICTCTC